MDYVVSTSMQPNSAFTLYARDIASNISRDYIAFHRDSNTVILISGDIVQSGYDYICSDCDVYTIAHPSYEFKLYSGRDSSSIRVTNSDNYVVYSSIGYNPSLTEGSIPYVQAALLLFAVTFMLFLLMRIFKHVS